MNNLKDTSKKTASLRPIEIAIIENKSTEAPFSGAYCEPKSHGTYLCRACGLALFRADNQFHSGCGWPSFDLEIKDHVKHLPDQDGQRTEIVCARCDAHLGHVFTGEQFTARNLRYCVNSISLDFVENQTVLDTEEAILAAGCFWGVEYYFKQLPGVLKTEVGYSGGSLENPSYQAVCEKNTGHLEVLRVIFDPKKISYENVLKYFFEIHDATQMNGQGPDIGEQYTSAVFYENEKQKATAETLVKLLKAKGYSVATTIRPAKTFWPAESYHQDYYQKTGKEPYCHRHVKIF